MTTESKEEKKDTEDIRAFAKAVSVYLLNAVFFLQL